MVGFIGWFVHQPLRILLLGALYVVAWAILRRRRQGRQADCLLWPATLCLVFAGWEWLVAARTPDANIRFDLLLIWPVLLAVTIWSMWRALRP